MEYVFLGQLTPAFKRIQFNIENPPLRFTVDSPIGKFNYTLLLNDTSDIIVVIESENEILDIPTLLNTIRFLTQSFYDTALMQCGISCNVTFTSALLPNKTSAPINIQDVSSWLKTNIFDFPTEELFRLSNDPVVRVAIMDIKFACLEPDLTALFSFRAIEGIMNSFESGQNYNRKKNWDLLRENLNISRSLINPVAEHSKLNRHGKPYTQIFSERQLCIHTAMIILQRYLHFLKQGRRKLDPLSFPEIKAIDDLSKSY